MILIEEIVNSIFTSKSYILYHKGDNKAWIVDVGDTEPVISFLEKNALHIEGVFITHAHFDHIYGLPHLVEMYPNCNIYVTEYAKNGLASDKLNMSRYHETPLTYSGGNVVIVHEGESLTLFEDEPQMLFYETPGHNPGCLTMVIGNLIFTGDAYIPGVKVSTQLPYANKEQAKESVEKIIKLASGKKILSGHKI